MLTNTTGVVGFMRILQANRAYADDIHGGTKLTFPETSNSYFAARKPVIWSILPQRTLSTSAAESISFPRSRLIRKCIDLRRLFPFKHVFGGTRFETRNNGSSSNDELL